MKIGLLGPANSSHLMKLANGFVGSGHEVLIVSIHEPCEGYQNGDRNCSCPHHGDMSYVGFS